MINLQEVALRVKFFAKVSGFGKDSLGKDRYAIIFPKEVANEGKNMKGKHVKVIVEEMTVDNDNNDDDHKKTNSHRKLK